MKPRRLLAIIPIAVGLFATCSESAKDLVMWLPFRARWLLLGTVILATIMAGLVWFALCRR